MHPHDLGGRRLTFLVGVFRSGTSLLHRLVNRHPEVRLMWEADPLRFLGTKTGTGWVERLDLWNGCISRHQIDTSCLPRRATREEAAIAMYQAYAAQPQIRVIGEKSPYYADILPRLARDFPLARFLVIHREPTAIVESVRHASSGNHFFSAPWMPLRVIKDTGRLRRDAMHLREQGHSVTEVDFEKLVADPGRTVAEIWSTLGLDPNPEQVEETAISVLPPGNHHRLAACSKVDPTRAIATTPGRLIDRHRRLRSLRNENRNTAPLDARDQLLLARDESIYQAIRGFECSKRLAFRHAPLPWLRHHRRVSGHKVVSDLNHGRSELQMAGLEPADGPEHSNH